MDERDLQYIYQNVVFSFEAREVMSRFHVHNFGRPTSPHTALV